MVPCRRLNPKNLRSKQMRGSRRSPVIVAILAMTLALALGSGFSQPAPGSLGGRGHVL